MKKAIILLCCFVLHTFFIFSQIPLNGLVGKYSFSGNADNEAGNNANGVVSGAVLTADRCGNPNSAYLFNGVSDYISISNFKLFANNEITISLWAKAASLSSNCMIMMSPDNWNDRCVVCGQYVGNPTYFIWDYGNCNSGGRTLINGPSFNTQWHHYVFITSFSQNIKKIYIDSICVSSQTFMGSLINYTRDMYVGGGTDWSGGDIGFAGSIDDIRIYNRGLSDPEVMDLYNELACFTGLASSFGHSGELNINAYPNPNNGFFILSFRYPESEKVTVQITNLLGEMIFRETDEYSRGYYNKPVNLQKFPSGIYSVKVRVGETGLCKTIIISK